MTKFVHDDTSDGALAIVATANKITVCSTGAELTFTNANTTGGKMLAALSGLTTGDGGGQYTFAATGTAGGRKCTVAQTTGVTVEATGTALSVALLDTSTSKVVLQTDCSSQALSSTGTAVTVASFVYKLPDPT